MLSDLLQDLQQNRLLLGTARYPSLQIMQDAIKKSESRIITVSLRRQLPTQANNQTFWNAIKNTHCRLLPNTAGCQNADDAIYTAELAREMFQTNWVKLEVIGDEYTLQPDPFELVKAADILIKKGFFVLPYCTDDLVLCKRLVDCGCEVLMPWAAPIGSGRGVINRYALETIRNRFPDKILIVDAGIGKPSHAAMVMEMGFDAVLLNNAVARSADPVQMANAFSLAISAGRMAFVAGMIAESNVANPSTPLIDVPFWKQETV